MMETFTFVGKRNFEYIFRIFCPYVNGVMDLESNPGEGYDEDVVEIRR